MMTLLNLTSLFPPCTLYPGNPFYISPIKKGCNNPSGYCNRAIIVYIFLRPLILRPCISTGLPTYSYIFNTLSQYHISLVPSTNFYKQVAFCKIIRNKWHRIYCDLINLTHREQKLIIIPHTSLMCFSLQLNSYH